MAACRILGLAAADVMAPRVLGRRVGPLLFASPLDAPPPTVLGLLAPLLPFAAGAIYRDGPSIPGGMRWEGGYEKPDDAYIATAAAGHASDAYFATATAGHAYFATAAAGHASDAYIATAAAGHASDAYFARGHASDANEKGKCGKDEPFIPRRQGQAFHPERRQRPERRAVLEECLTTTVARALLELEEWLLTAAASPSMSVKVLGVAAVVGEAKMVEALFGAAVCALWAPRTATAALTTSAIWILLAGSLGEQSEDGHGVPRVGSGEVKKDAVAISGGDAGGGGRAAGGRRGQSTGGQGAQGSDAGGQNGGRRGNNKPAWARGLERQMAQVKCTVLILAKKLDCSIAETVSHRLTVKSVGQSLMVRLPVIAFIGEFAGFILGAVIVFKYGIPYLLGIIADEMVNWFSELNLTMEDVDRFIEHVKDKMLENVSLWSLIFGKKK